MGADLNYYRRYIGDYAAGTPHLSLLEHGAYTLLLDAYYTAERPLPHSLDLLYRICRAQTPAEKKAVLIVADQYFPSDGEFRHNARADKELGIAVPKLNKLRAVAKVNGLKGGRPPKETKTITKSGTGTGLDVEPNPVQKDNPDESNHQPPTTRSSTTAFPVVETSGPSAPPAGAEENPAPQHPRLTKIISECKRAQVHDLQPDDPIIARWIATGATDTLIVKALTLARAQGAKPTPAILTLGYVDAIVQRITAEETGFAKSAAARVERTQAAIAEQRKAAEVAVPRPVDFPTPSNIASKLRHIANAEDDDLPL